MRNKNLITTKLERIESELRKLNFSIGRNERKEAYDSTDICSAVLGLCCGIPLAWPC